MEPTTKNGWWTRFRNGLRKIFRKNNRAKSVEKDCLACKIETTCPTEFATTAVGFNECVDVNRMDFSRNSVEQKSERLNVVYAESKLRNEQMVAELCHVQQENHCQSIKICELEAKLCGFKARTKKLEAAILKSQTTERQLAKNVENSVKANSKLNAELSRLEQKKDFAVKKMGEAKSVIQSARRIVESAVYSAERREVQEAKHLDILSSAAADLESLLSSLVVDIRLDGLPTVTEKLQLLLSEMDDEDEY